MVCCNYGGKRRIPNNWCHKETVIVELAGRWLCCQYDSFEYTYLPGLTKAVFVTFAILVPILLLNMLIAMMGNTYQQIIRRSAKEWKRQVRPVLFAFCNTIKLEKS